jgi:plastocyanin
MARVFAVASAIAIAGTLAGAVAAQAATRNVTAGPPVQQRPAGVPRDADTNAFYPRTVTIHRGDRVQWRINGFHTVTLPRRGNRPPEFVVPDPANPVSGVVDAAGAPFWFNGQPRFIANPLVAFKQGGGAYTGRRLLNSGVPAGAGAPPPYTVRFPATGTYRYYCAIHVGNPDMQGTVRVVSGRRSIPSAAETRREASRQFARAIVQVKRDDRFAGPQGNAVAAGVDSAISTLFRFRPATKTVKAGTTVTWQMPQRSNEAHTVTFGPPDFLHTQAEALITPAAGGVLAVNPLAVFPSEPPPTLPPYPGAQHHGNGYFNTGFIDRDPRSQPPPSVGITFATPGTYSYVCLLHEQPMKGQIIVTP